MGCGDFVHGNMNTNANTHQVKQLKLDPAVMTRPLDSGQIQSENFHMGSWTQREKLCPETSWEYLQPC